MIPDLGQGPYPTLRNAPITEAIIDIRVQLPSDVTLETLRSIRGVLAPRFPKMDERVSVEAQIKVDSDGAQLVGPPPHPDGYLLRSEAEPVRVQVRLDGFTTNRLSPYTRWAEFSSDARELWNLYKKTAQPTKITRLAVRYINRLELIPNRDFKDFLLTVPELAPGLPQNVADYVMRVVLPLNSGALAVVTQGTLPRDPSLDKYPIVLDIDVFRSVDLSPESSEIWSIMEELRNYKNQIFFGSLNPAFLETFE